MFEQCYDMFFMQWCQVGEQCGVFGQCCQFVVVYGFDLVVNYYFVSIQFYFMVYFCCYQFVVVGEDFYCDVVGFQCFQCWGGGFFWWIEEGDVIFKDQV